MIRGDINEGIRYRDLIIKQIETELSPTHEQMANIIKRLNNASSDELMRAYEAFDRFGVKTIIQIVCGDKI